MTGAIYFHRKVPDCGAGKYIPDMCTLAPWMSGRKTRFNDRRIDPRCASWRSMKGHPWRASYTQRTTYSSRSPITTFASVDSFTFCPRRIAMIVSLWSPVRFANLRSEAAFIASSKLWFAATRPPS
jgi:hypothetical protein